MTSTAIGTGIPMLRRSDIVGVCGDIVDWKIAAIIATGASLAELETANAWAIGEDEFLGEEHEPLSGPTARVYDILVADDAFDEDR